MERTQIFDLMSELKLYGMKTAYDEIMATGIKRQYEPPHIVGDLLQAEVSEKQARSIKYQIAIAKLPLAKDLDDFQFAGTPINERLVRDLAQGDFLVEQRNCVLVGGTGTGKTHLAIAIARNCIRAGKRGRFYNTVDLVNRLETEARGGRQGRIAEYLIRKDFVVLDELGTPRHDDLSVSAQSDGRDNIGAVVHGSVGRSDGMTDTPQILLAHHLKALKLPTFLREYDKVARLCAAEGVDHPRYLMRLAEMEMIDRERRMVERRIKAARFPTVKSLDSFDFLALPSLNKMLVLELARSDYVERRENIIAVGNSGTGKTHIALGLGLAACQKGLSVGFITASALVHELLEARDEKRLLRLQRQLAGYKLLIIDELGYVPLSATGAELLFEVFSQRYERGSTLVTSNLPFDEWTSVFGSERLTGALLDRLTHHVHVLEMNGDSFRLAHSKRRSRRARSEPPSDAAPQE